MHVIWDGTILQEVQKQYNIAAEYVVEEDACHMGRHHTSRGTEAV